MSEPSQPTPNLISLSPKLFIRDLSSWTLGVGNKGLQAGGKTVWQAGYAIEHAKDLIVDAIRSRDSKLARPYSPIGVGGLTAVIGVGGLLFGHNGVVNSSLVANSEAIPAVQSATATTALLQNDLIIDSADVQTVIPADRLRDSVITHQVTGGDSLESIAKEYNVSVDSLRYVNNLSSESDKITPGQNLTILPISGVLHEVKSGESLQGIADAWKISAQAIVDVNWLDEPYTVQAGQKLVIPGAEIPKPTPTPGRTPSAPSNLATTPVRGNGKFIWPVSGQVSQYFSYYHNGIDIANHGVPTQILAAGSGTVTFAGWWSGGGGNSVWIDHGDGYVTMYAHMSRIMASVGQRVSQGTQIGVTGATGRAYGIHLHFMVEKGGRVINPMSVL